jgi:hypothetical protein
MPLSTIFQLYRGGHADLFIEATGLHIGKTTDLPGHLIIVIRTHIGKHL